MQSLQSSSIALEQLVDDVVVATLPSHLVLHRGPYNICSPELRAEIGQYAVQHGTARHTR